MRKRTAIGAGIAGAAAALALGGAALATGSGDDGEGSVTGEQADRATQAALQATHGGTANAVERDGENGATWEVEVTKPDGNTVDVRLDASYGRVAVEGDGGEQGDANVQGEANDAGEHGEANDQADANEAGEHGNADDAQEQG